MWLTSASFNQLQNISSPGTFRIKSLKKPIITPKMPRVRKKNRKAIKPEPVCRICRAPGCDENKLVEPCLCKGSIAEVHLRCLEDWLNSYSETTNCEICLFEYTVEDVYTYPMFKSIGIWVERELSWNDICTVLLMIIRMLLAVFESFYAFPRFSQFFTIFNAHSLFMLVYIGAIVKIFRKSGIAEVIHTLVAFVPAACIIQIYLFYERLRGNDAITFVGLVIRAMLAVGETILVFLSCFHSTKETMVHRMMAMILMSFKTNLAIGQLVLGSSKILFLDELHNIAEIEMQLSLFINMAYSMYLTISIHNTVEYIEDWWEWWTENKRIILKNHVE